MSVLLYTETGEDITIRPHQGLLNSPERYWEVDINGDYRIAIREAIKLIASHKEFTHYQISRTTLEELLIACKCYDSAYNKPQPIRTNQFDFMREFVKKYQKLKK